ncbi:methylated-DNA--[protein]-cysteine S-methyltransferase [Halorubellus sp. JP-L1]|uniref:MGMT family protein n=1 Tax=Halorubellus sp. JP-L1 TaxID=2715753 RepID=UPI00140B2F3F|nr:MGMT family protein [Halorubellus sp. JP-L1]NHN42384.1 methylated-DNA--[protein]-cysteine S-methyltransferase [Halorubellus sp. JP-L1]
MDDADTAGIYAREIDYLERYVQFGVASGRVISVSFPETAPEDASDTYDLLDRFERYCEGISEEDFADVEVGLTVPTGERKVLETLRQVGYGEQVSVAQLANMTPTLDPDDEQDVITVREALAENPLPVLVPDHRVRDGPSALPPQVEQQLRSLEDL